MDARLTSLLFATAFCAASAEAQSLGATMKGQQPETTLQTPAGNTPQGCIRLAPANRFNTKPEDIAKTLVRGLRPNRIAATMPAAKTAATAPPARIPAAANVADSVVVYGIVKPTPDEPTEFTPFGLYSFHAAPELDLRAEAGGVSFPDCYAYIRANDKYYITEQGKISELDANTGEVLRTASLQINGAEMTPLQLGCFEPVSGKVYFGAWDDNWNKILFALDLETLAYEQVYNFGSEYPLSMAAGRAGRLYVMLHPGNLYELNIASGELTLVKENAYAGDVAYQNATASQSAAVDLSTNQMYLANLDQRFTFHLSKIDLVTGEAVHIAQTPGNDRLVGLYIPSAPAAAPGFAHGIAFADGKLQFTAPAKTYDGAADLSGSLTACISVDGAPELAVNVTPGQAVEQVLDLAEGAHVVEISMENGAGRSPFRRLNFFLGADLPKAVENLSLNADDGHHLTLSWTAPSVSQNGGYVDDNAISYRVVRYPDALVVAENLKETTFSEAIPERHDRYYYTVTARVDGKDGGTAQTNVIPAGSIIEVPYTETFKTQADFDFYKVIDHNEDGSTWYFMQPYGLDDGYAYMNGNYSGGDDDYLISPSIRLKKGVDYRISFRTYDQWMLEETMTILLGQSREVTGNETVLADCKLAGNSQYEYVFHVEEDGLYNLMLHGNTAGTSLNITVDDLALNVYAAFEGPAAVTEAAAQAGEKGALNNTLTFTAPTLNYQGGALEAIDRIEVYRNDETAPAKVFDAVQPGQALSWYDTDVAQGSVTYRIVPFNAAGQGCEVKVTNWVGIDVPADVTNLKARMDENFHAVATWDKVGEVGAHGGYVDTSEVTYNLYRYNQYDWYNPWQLVAEGATEATLADSTFTPSWGAQQEYADYLVAAVNSAGISNGAGFGITLGEPYANPYAESFAGGFATLSPWTLFANSYYYAWNMQTGAGLAVKPYDGDDGMLQFSLIADDSNEQVIAGPRISLADLQDGELSFYMYHGFEAEPGDLTLKVWTNYDDEGWVMTDSVDYNNGAEGWSRFSMPLRSDAKDLQIAFGAYAADASAAIYIDNIAVEQGVPNELAIEGIRADKRIAVGGTSKIDVAVSNYGMQTAENFKVKLFKNGQFFAEKTVESLEKNNMAHVSFDFTAALSDASQKYFFRAELADAADANPDNNASAEVHVFVKGSVLPAPVALTGENKSHSVVLQWNAPATDEIADPATDDFESYETFIIDSIGDWAVYDGDGCIPVYFGGPEVPNTFVEKAWQIWAPEEAGFSLETFPVLTPHSGSKVATCWAASDGVSQTLPNDDWLISPDVVGGTDVGFWYRVPNEGSDPQIFEMMYSSTDREVESFSAFDRDSLVGTTEWRYFEYTLPADAKYFALRSCSKGAYTVAMLDDITYTPLYGSKSKLAFKGYNVYRDDQLLASGITETTYTDQPELNRDHVYTVTAVWEEGESNASNSFEGLVTKIDALPGAADLKVFTRKGSIRIQGQAGQTLSLTNAAGQQIFNGTTRTDETTLRVAPGVYLVTVGQFTYKMIVK